MTTVIPFSRYNDEFSSLTSQTRDTLSTITALLSKYDNDNHDIQVDVESASTSEADKKTMEQKVTLAQNLLNQTKDLLKQMTIESRSLKSNTNNNNNTSQNDECQQMLRTAKANHANLKDDVNSISNKVNHYLLLSSSSSNNNNTSSKRNKKNGINSEVRQHLLSTTTSLHNQNSNLENSKKIMADTELIAMEISQELQRNRETIESTSSRVRGVSSLTNHARRILINMNRREVQQKMVVYGVGVVLFLVLLFLLGFF